MVHQAPVGIGRETYQHIDIAVVTEILAQRRTEYRQFSDPPAGTEACDEIPVEFDFLFMVKS